MFKIFILASDEYFDNLWVDFDEIEANSTVQIMSQMNLNKSELIKYQYQRIYDQGKSTFHLYKNPKLKKSSIPRDFSTQFLPAHLIFKTFKIQERKKDQNCLCYCQFQQWFSV